MMGLIFYELQANLLIETDRMIKTAELLILKCGRTYAVIFEYMGEQV